MALLDPGSEGFENAERTTITCAMLAVEGRKNGGRATPIHRSDPVAESFFVNGIDGRTGAYLDEPLTADEVADRLARSDDVTREKRAAERSEKGVLGLPPGARAENLSNAGWALVTHKDDVESIGRELDELLQHRQSAIGKSKVHHLVYRGGNRAEWLAAHDVAAGEIDPTKVPYYLLFAGSSAKLPFRLIHELCVDYAVGRLEFDDLADYRAYAANVVRHETNGSTPPRQIAFFAPRHDKATTLSADHLISPLASSFDAEAAIGGNAKKSRLLELISSNAPAVLFTASHGISWSSGDPLQAATQGALLCQDWKGGPPLAEHLFAASDVPDSVDLRGRISFNFACYSAGTPEINRFPSQGGPAKLAKTDFVAALPRALLRRGALACVGHVERAWGFSITPPATGAQIGPFRNFLTYILSGYPIGYAVKDFRERYAALTVHLFNEWLRARSVKVSKESLARLEIERNDAEAYVVIGDPAARLKVSQ